jgi:hypothetical protein
MQPELVIDEYPAMPRMEPDRAVAERPAIEHICFMCHRPFRWVVGYSDVRGVCSTWCAEAVKAGAPPAVRP